MSETATAGAGTGAATATAATTTDTGTTTTTDATGTGAATQTATGTATAGTGTAPTVEQLQADVEKWKALSRKNEAAAKAKGETDAAQKKLLAEVAAKLGIQTGDGQVDPAQITAQLEASQREAKARSNELAVLRAAGRLGADGDALLDSRAFMSGIEGLEGAEAIESAIKLAVAQSPARYGRAGAANGTSTATDTSSGTTATTTASASTAGTFDGQQGGNRQWTQADVDRATPAQVSKALEQGLLKNLLSS